MATTRTIRAKTRHRFSLPGRRRSARFWSINNYAHAAVDDDLRSADYGIGKYQQQAGLPVMISETGHSSTEDLPGYEGAAERQPKALPSQVWESLLSGAIGTHIFHWSDRSQFTRGYFLRERGFGIVEQTRRIKSPVFDNVLAMFRRMEDVRSITSWAPRIRVLTYNSSGPGLRPGLAERQ
jgi:hypothetical protein